MKLFFVYLSRPHTWYPNARKKQRKVFLHVGPTNSGKTYHALKRLESSSSGIFTMLLLPGLDYLFFYSQ